MNRDVYWRPTDSVGLEHLHLVETETDVKATGAVLGGSEREPFGISYRVCCDAEYRVTDVQLERLEPAPASLTLHADGEGVWFDGEQSPLTEIEGCIDVDISATPFSNTLPIRRLELDVDESATVTVAYVSVPELRVETATQRYTRLDDRPDDWNRYRYESLSSGFTAELPVDDDGLVMDYPGAFERVRLE